MPWLWIKGPGEPALIHSSDDLSRTSAHWQCRWMHGTGSTRSASRRRAPTPGRGHGRTHSGRPGKVRNVTRPVSRAMRVASAQLAAGTAACGCTADAVTAERADGRVGVRRDGHDHHANLIMIPTHDTQLADMSITPGHTHVDIGTYIGELTVSARVALGRAIGMQNAHILPSQWCSLPLPRATK